MWSNCFKKPDNREIRTVIPPKKVHQCNESCGFPPGQQRRRKEFASNTIVVSLNRGPEPGVLESKVDGSCRAEFQRRGTTWKNS